MEGIRITSEQGRRPGLGGAVGLVVESIKKMFGVGESSVFPRPGAVEEELRRGGLYMSMGDGEAIPSSQRGER